MRTKHGLFIVISIILTGLALLLAGEAITRLFGATNVYQYDARLGWRPKENFSTQIPVIDQSGASYAADYSTNAFGFRTFVNPDNTKKRILFVGDSWTGDPNTSDEDAYFGVVGKDLPVEIFAIGGGGYGTLQELMLIREYASLIKPDIFVLQYCDNDLINNSFALEAPRITRNQKNFRPYWVDGQVRYRLAGDSWYVLLHRYSRLFRTLDMLWSMVQYKMYQGYYPPGYRAYDGVSPAQSPVQKAEITTLKKTAIATTEILLQAMKEALPDKTKRVTFAASTDVLEEKRIWQDLAGQAGFVAYPSVSQKVEAAEASGVIVRVQDGAHW
ncbi:MAG: hypothetical protein P8Y96_14255, partial [Desulfuromonadales bacterium]